MSKTNIRWKMEEGIDLVPIFVMSVAAITLLLPLLAKHYIHYKTYSNIDKVREYKKAGELHYDWYSKEYDRRKELEKEVESLKQELNIPTKEELQLPEGFSEQELKKIFK